MLLAYVVQEEEQRELEMKQLEAARYEQEIKMAQREAEEEKVRRKQAYQRSALSCCHTGRLCVLHAMSSIIHQWQSCGWQWPVHHKLLSVKHIAI